ncbi:MAG TPA: plasmid replication, integration and excision activator [Streptosporangiaceae bacterium]
MALQGPIPIEFGAVFPGGAYAAGGFEMVRDFDRSTPDRAVQQADKHTGLPLWTVEVIDADPDARQRTVKVKVAAQVQPVLPPPVAGSPFTPVEFDGMTATPYVDGSRCQGHGRCAARQAHSLKATGVRSPSRGIGRPSAEHKDAA